MAAESILLDPVTEDAANSELQIVGTVSTDPYFLLDHKYPPPDDDLVYATSADTEGDPIASQRFKNRKITVKLRISGTTQAAFDTAVRNLQQKIGKLAREGGSYKRTTLSGLVVVFDVVDAVMSAPDDQRGGINLRTDVQLDFEAKPFGRLASILLADHVEAALPALIFTEAAIPGDVPALGQLQIDDDQGQDQLWLTWGLQSRYYDPAASAALFYEAEGRTALSGSATAAGPAGASGAGNNVMRQGNLTPNWQAILSTQATGGGAHLSHIGTYRVFARVQTPVGNTGQVSVRLGWSVGDFRSWTQNDATVFPVDSWDTTWRLLDLGTVILPKARTGTQRWEGRIGAKSTVAGDDIDVDWLLLVPTDEGSGEAAALQTFETPTAVLARDEFDQAAGALNAVNAPVGGAWATSGDAGDLTIETAGHTVTRATNDAGAGRFAISGLAASTNQLVQVDFKTSTLLVNVDIQGVVGRYIDANNRLSAYMSQQVLSVSKYVGGALTIINKLQPPPLPRGADTWYSIRLLVTASGRYLVWFFTQGSTPTAPMIQGYDADLATGGPLASGKVGFRDNGGGPGGTRNYDNFMAATPVLDTAIPASRSAQVRHDSVIRQDAAGQVWVPESQYEGDYLLVPPTGREGRTARFVVKASRGDTTSLPDTGTDDISARLTIQPRVLALPE